MSTAENSRRFIIKAAFNDGQSQMRGINLAIKLAGGACELASQLGVSHQIVYIWARRGWVPGKRALQIENAYNIPRIDLIDPKIVAFLTMRVEK